MAQKGLTSSEVRQLTEDGKINRVPDKASRSVPSIFFHQIFTYFNAIFAFLAILLIITGSFRSLTFLPVVIANTLIGIFQQLRSKKVLDELALLDMSEYTAIRDGAEVKVAADKLVLGDVIKLAIGQQIPADAVVLEGEAGVNESLLTGESDEVEKKPGSELKSGSFLTAGSIIARLTHVGAESYAAQLTARAKEVKDKKSEMIRDIEAIIKTAGILIIPIGGILLYQSMAVNGNSFHDSVVSMVGAVIGMIPEGMYLLLTMALALSAMRLAKSKVLLHDMRSIETLARVDVLCLDKTGTITSEDMNVRPMISPWDTRRKPGIFWPLTSIPCRIPISPWKRCGPICRRESPWKMRKSRPLIPKTNFPALSLPGACSVWGRRSISCLPGNMRKTSP